MPTQDFPGFMGYKNSSAIFWLPLRISLSLPKLRIHP